MVASRQMNTLIILNGYSEIPALLADTLGEFALIIVTDGAVNSLPAWITPHVICGDFDSTDPRRSRERFPDAEIVELPDQSSSDLEKALNLALARGATQITLTKSHGGRIDHFLSVISSLVTYHTKVNISVVEDQSVTWVVSPDSISGASKRVRTTPGDLISALPLTPKAVVSLRNTEWPLECATITAGTGGVSNRAIGPEVQVEVHQGTICLCHLGPKWG